MYENIMKQTESKRFLASYSHSLLCFALWIVGFGIPTVISQSYVVEGQIMAKDTEEGIPFANIYFKNSQKGMATDLEGFFKIALNSPNDILEISSVGYLTKTITLKDTTYQLINVTLLPSEVITQELTVYAGENPANAIVRNIIKNKKDNRLSSFGSYEFQVYDKIELDLYNFDTSMFDRKALEPFKFILENVDSTSDEKIFLPAYINENITQVYGLDSRQEREILKASKVSGVDGTSVVKQVKRFTQKYDIYDNWIYVLEKNFVSPFSNSALLFYEYYIMDSTYIDNQWSYKLKFKPRRKQENTFYGEFWVIDTSFAIQQVSLRKSPDVNINLIDRITIYEDYKLTDNKWLPNKKKILVDFLPTDKLAGMIARKTSLYDNFVLNDTATVTRYKEADPELILPTDLKQSEDFWKENRPDTLSKNEEMIYVIVDSMKNTPRYQVFSDATYALTSGWIKVGKLEAGEWFNIYGVNPVEGNRFRLGVGTNLEVSTTYRGEIFAAYGTKDKEWKYGGQFQYNFKKIPHREQIVFSFFDDVVFTTRSSEDVIASSSISSFVRRDAPQRIIRAQETKFLYLRDFKKGLTAQATFLHRILDPYGKIYADGAGFNFVYINPETNFLDTTVNTAEFIVKLRHAYKEQYWSGHFDRVSTGSKYPIYFVQYTAGVKNILGSQYNYHKIGFDFSHWFYMNPIGWTRYTIRAGKTFGTLPSLLLEIHPGNESFIYSSTNFNLMNRYEFTSDAYVSWSIIHHFDGLFLNKIPLLRKLKWREVVHFRGVYGTLTAANADANRLNTADVGGTIPFRAPSPVPYMEAGIGIENIFRIFQIQATWRLNYLDNPEATPFLLQGGVYFNF
jgi:hypothetical protein